MGDLLISGREAAAACLHIFADTGVLPCAEAQAGAARHTQTAVFTLRLPAALIVTAGNNSVVLHSIHTLIQTAQIFAGESLLDRLAEWLFVP